MPTVTLVRRNDHRFPLQAPLPSLLRHRRRRRDPHLRDGLQRQRPQRRRRPDGRHRHHRLRGRARGGRRDRRVRARHRAGVRPLRPGRRGRGRAGPQRARGPHGAGDQGRLRRQPREPQRHRLHRVRLRRRAGDRLHAQPVVVARRPHRPVPRRLPGTAAAPDLRAGGQLQHALALAAAGLVQRPQALRARPRHGRLRTRGALPAGHRHSRARAARRERAHLRADRAWHDALRAVRRHLHRRRRHAVGGARRARGQAPCRRDTDSSSGRPCMRTAQPSPSTGS